MKVEIKFVSQDKTPISVDVPDDTPIRPSVGAALGILVKAGADLRGADLSGADLISAKLSGADLSDACLIGANLTSADLSGANLTSADLSGARLNGAALSGADLNGRKVVRLVARLWRIEDPYEFFGFAIEGSDEPLIRAGCRTMMLGEYRQHVAKEYPGTTSAAETLAILDYIEARSR
jgi:hypothetical protein